MLGERVTCCKRGAVVANFGVIKCKKMEDGELMNPISDYLRRGRVVSKLISANSREEMFDIARNMFPADKIKLQREIKDINDIIEAMLHNLGYIILYHGAPGKPYSKYAGSENVYRDILTHGFKITKGLRSGFMVMIEWLTINVFS